nr:hypothetical protein [Tanacetum cinerariifolium]
EAVALFVEGTPVVVAPDAFSTRVANLFKDERLETVEVNFSSFKSLLDPQLAKSCEAKSLDSSGFREVTRSPVSWLIDGGVTEVSSVSLSFSEVSFSSLTYETMIGSSVRESGVKKADLVSFKISAKSSSFTFWEMSSAHDSLFLLEVVWAVFNLYLADLVLSTRTLGLDPASM